MRHPAHARLALIALIALASCPAIPAGACAQEPAQVHEGRRAVHSVTIPLPITGMVDVEVKQSLRRVLAKVDRTTGRRPIVVLEFANETDDGSGGSEFERSLSLARFLSSDEVSYLRLIAYVPDDVVGHGVLPVIACEEIVMHPKAILGDAGRYETAIDRTMQQAYSEIATRRRTVPEPVALGMLQAERSLYRATSLEGVTYVGENELAELRDRTTVSAVDSLTGVGEWTRFSGSDLRGDGFVSHLAEDRQALAAALQIPPESLTSNFAQFEVWEPVRLALTGPVNGKTVNWMIRSLETEVARGVNLVVLTIDSPGGSHADSVRLADFLASLDQSRVRTVAFVPDQALADAALPAFACDEIWLGAEAQMGGAGATTLSEREVPEWREAVKAIAKRTGRDWSVPAGMADPTLSIYRYRNAASGMTRYFCLEELGNQADPAGWQQEGEFTLQKGLNGREAEQMGLIDGIADSYGQLRNAFDLPEDVASVEPNWAHFLIESLASPKLAATLLFIGWLAFFMEFSQPGLGIPGFVAGVCFLLFFWSNFLHGTAGWLEVVLFTGGVLAILLEVFVIPGFGIFGLGGAAMIVVSMVLASQTFVIPRNAYQLEQVPQSLLVVLAALGGALGSLAVLYHYLEEVPILSRILLPPPAEDERIDLARRESPTDLSHLLGKRGRTSTPLTPSGKAQFGDDVINVMSEGELVSRGVDVVVSEVRGNYALVRVVQPETISS